MKYISLIIIIFLVSCLIYIPHGENIKKIKKLTKYRYSDVAVYKNYVIADCSIIDVKDPKKPRFVKEICDLIKNPMDDTILVKENYLYYTGGVSYFGIIDITDITNPKLLSSVASDEILPQYVHFAKFTILGDYAYISSWDYPGSGFTHWGSLTIINISDPRSPKLEGYVGFEGSSFGNAVQGDYAYVAAKENGMYIINIKDKKEPWVVSNFREGDARFDRGIERRYMAGGYCVAVKGNYAYLTDLGRILVVDISNPYKPRLAAKYESGKEYGVKFSQGYVAYTAGRPFDIEIEGDYAYVADEYGGIIVLDISEPTKPKCVGYYTGGYKNIAISGNYLYAVINSALESGLTIFDISKIKKLKEKFKK